MGRELRRVPPGWQHPTFEDLDAEEWGRDPKAFHPLYDANYEDRATKWAEECALWAEGKHPDQQKGRENLPAFFWDWDGNPPDKNYYRHGQWAFKPEEATHFQMYEDTTEGTPKSPAFATIEEVARYCADNNVSAFAGMTATYEQWLATCKAGYAPSMVMSTAGIESGVAFAANTDKEEGDE